MCLNLAKKKKKKFWSRIFKIHNNKTAPLTEKKKKNLSPPTRKKLKKLLKNISIEDLIQENLIIEDNNSENNYINKIRLTKRPNTAPSKVQLERKESAIIKLNNANHANGKSKSIRDNKLMKHSKTEENENNVKKGVLTKKVQNNQPDYDLIESVDLTNEETKL